MSSRAGPSRQGPLPQFPDAQVLTLSSRGRTLESLHPVKLAISHRIWWKSVKENIDDEPVSLYDFRGCNSLELDRLPSDSVWNRSEDDPCNTKCVEETVKLNDEYGVGLLVRGKLHGPARRSIKSASFSGDVRIIIVAADSAKRNRWLEVLRLRVAPWQAVQRRARHISARASIEDITERLEGLILRDVCNESRSDTTIFNDSSQISKQASTDTPRPRYFSERIQHVDWVEKLMAQIAGITGIIAKTVKMRADNLGANGEPSDANETTAATGIVGTASKAIKDNVSAEGLANTASVIGDYARVVPGGVSVLFHLVVLGARLVASCAEAGRGRRELPNILGRVLNLLHCVTESVAPVLQSSVSKKKSEEILESNVFEVLVSLFDVIGKIEEQLMKSELAQVWNASAVKDIEAEVRDLEKQVVPVVLTKKLIQSERYVSPLLETLHPRPILSPFFVGRRNELKKLREIVLEFGSAVISQYGGVGKTQLMVAFAEKADRENAVPGGIYWVLADGGAAKISRSLANLAEAISLTQIPEDEKVKPSIAVSALSQALSSQKNRWLLCLDNVDEASDPEVSGILDAISALAKPSEQNGWIVVTSRHSRSNLWSRMSKQQKITLNPFTEEDAMCVLWRIVHSKNIEDCEDACITNFIQEWRLKNEAEYHSLRVLSGYKENYSLGGLALALVQAGSYIRTYECSFSEYLEDYKDAYEQCEVEELFHQSEEVSTVRKEQRSVWTTWKISAKKLSPLALKVLRILSLLGNAPVPEVLVSNAFKCAEDGRKSRVKYRKVVMKELVYGSSLLQFNKISRKKPHFLSNRMFDRIRLRSAPLQCNETPDDISSLLTGHNFDMHRLVRMFVILDMKVDRSEWEDVLDKAFSISASIMSHFCNERRYFSKLPDMGIISDWYSNFLPHSLSLVSHADFNSSSVEKLLPDLVPVLRFAAKAKLFFGRYREAMGLYVKLIRVLEIVGMRKNLDIAVESLYRLGYATYQTGGLEAARDIYLTVITMMEERKECYNSLIHAEAYYSLGYLYVHEMRTMANAKAILEKALSMYRSNLRNSENDIRIAALLHMLGIVHQNQGELEEAASKNALAEEMYKKLSILPNAVFFGVPVTYGPDYQRVKLSLIS